MSEQGLLAVDITLLRDSANRVRRLGKRDSRDPLKPRRRRRLRAAYMRMFLLFDRVGIHILPKHYYSPIPDYRWLAQNKTLWTKRASLIGLEWDLDKQLDWLRRISESYLHEVQGLEFYKQVSSQGPGYGPIESQVLHCFIRTYSPRRIVEIGSGVSTACMLHALQMNEESSEIVSIEPYPHPSLRTMGVTLIEKPVQEVSIESLALGEGDLLFIDSSHAVKIGSDVVHIYLNVIPALPPGVFVHIHDINLPYAYPGHALTNIWGWQETALCLALLNENRRLEILCCQSALHYDRPSDLGKILPDYLSRQDRDEGLSLGGPGFFPNSLWLKTH